MHKIDSISIHEGGHERLISFWEGNPAETPADEPVDLIIVSAFRNNYVPTKWSIIGALDRRGLSVEALAQNKAIIFAPPRVLAVPAFGAGQIGGRRRSYPLF
jgi:hypothetical protein